MFAVSRARMSPIVMFARNSSYKARLTLLLSKISAAATACAVVVGCGQAQKPLSLVDSDSLSVTMPLSADSLGIYDLADDEQEDNGALLVAQPPRVPRELIPTPPGAPDPAVVRPPAPKPTTPKAAPPKAPVRPIKGELVPTPAGEPDPAIVESGTKTTVVEMTAAKDTPKSVPSPDKVSPAAIESIDEGLKGEAAAGPESWESWPVPQTVLFVTGNQHGYIEPCGCTGLENQKGGMARRFTLMKQLSDRGWPLVPIDAGNQVRRTGRQSEVKFQTAAAGLAEMNYQAVGFGPDDLRLGVGELIAVAASDDPQKGRFVSANVVLIDPSLMAQSKVIESGGRKIGVTSVLDPASIEGPQSDEIQVGDVNESVSLALTALKNAGSDFNVLMFYGEESAAAKAVQATKGFDLVVVAGGYGEPTYQAEPIEGVNAKMIVTGNKGMYTGLVGLYDEAPFKYARVALTHEFSDAPEMRRLMATYQDQLRSLGLDGLGLKPVAHPSGDKYVGTKACGECHKTAYEIWENSAHALATEHIVHPGERGDVSRHFDPECISCHVTGWNPQNYYPYDSGYLSLEVSDHLTGNGCENCHGPGARHAAAERENSGVDEAQRDLLRLAMQLPLESAKERCMECHDLDNSPDFHKDGAFDDYWAEVEHYGVD